MIVRSFLIIAHFNERENSGLRGFKRLKESSRNFVSRVHRIGFQSDASPRPEVFSESGSSTKKV
jgi:hypothetical protein